MRFRYTGCDNDVFAVEGIVEAIVHMKPFFTLVKIFDFGVEKQIQAQFGGEVAEVSHQHIRIREHFLNNTAVSILNTARNQTSIPDVRDILRNGVKQIFFVKR